MKLLKRNFFEVEKTSVLFKRTTLMDQFKIFHGSSFINRALNFLTEDNKKNFEIFLNSYDLNHTICSFVKM